MSLSPLHHDGMVLLGVLHVGDLYQYSSHGTVLQLYRCGNDVVDKEMNKVLLDPQRPSWMIWRRKNPRTWALSLILIAHVSVWGEDLHFLPQIIPSCSLPKTHELVKVPPRVHAFQVLSGHFSRPPWNKFGAAGVAKTGNAGFPNTIAQRSDKVIGYEFRF